MYPCVSILYFYSVFPIPTPKNRFGLPAVHGFLLSILPDFDTLLMV